MIYANKQQNTQLNEIGRESFEVCKSVLSQTALFEANVFLDSAFL